MHVFYLYIEGRVLKAAVHVHTQTHRDNHKRTGIHTQAYTQRHRHTYIHRKIYIYIHTDTNMQTELIHTKAHRI